MSLQVVASFRWVQLKPGALFHEAQMTGPGFDEPRERTACGLPVGVPLEGARTGPACRRCLRGPRHLPPEIITSATASTTEIDWTYGNVTMLSGGV